MPLRHHNWTLPSDYVVLSAIGAHSNVSLKSTHGKGRKVKEFHGQFAEYAARQLWRAPVPRGIQVNGKVGFHPIAFNSRLVEAHMSARPL